MRSVLIKCRRKEKHRMKLWKDKNEDEVKKIVGGCLCVCVCVPVNKRRNRMSKVEARSSWMLLLWKFCNNLFKTDITTQHIDSVHGKETKRSEASVLCIVDCCCIQTWSFCQVERNHAKIHTDTQWQFLRDSR